MGLHTGGPLGKSGGTGRADSPLSLESKEKEKKKWKSYRPTIRYGEELSLDAGEKTKGAEKNLKGIGGTEGL